MNKIQLFVAILILHLQIQFTIQAPTNFTIDLIHHYSKHSPFYNKSLTPSDILKRSVINSNARLINHMASRTNNFASTARPPIYAYESMYLLKFYIGTPPVQFFAIADTGSGIVWIQCSYCDKCFDPSKSWSYKPIPCTSQTCQDPNFYCNNENLCMYESRYWDGSLYTQGVLSTDIMSFDSNNDSLASFQNSVFGCGHDFQGDFFFEGPSAGIVGLGRGPLSLVSQLGPLIDYKFAHCLVHHTSQYPSKLRFGADAFSTGSEIYSTPLVTSNDMSNHYPVTLQGISVGERTTQTLQGEGNIIVDSGTTMTFLPPEIYDQVEYFVRLNVNLQPVQQDSTNMFKLCFSDGYISIDEFPSMIFHFDGVDLVLPPKNLFQTYYNMICMTILPTPIGLPIFGALAQMDMLIGYDLKEEKVYFGQADCTQY